MDSSLDLDFGWGPVVTLLVWIVGGVLLIALLLWILYTIIWNGVRRGLEEYYGPGEYKGYTVREPNPSSETESAEPMVRDRRHRSGRLTR